MSDDFSDFLDKFIVNYGNDSVVQDWQTVTLGSIAAVDLWIANNPSVLYYTITHEFQIVRQKVNGVVTMDLNDIFT